MTKTKLRLINSALFIAAALLFAHGYADVSILVWFAMGYTTRQIDELANAAKGADHANG